MFLMYLGSLSLCPRQPHPRWPLWRQKGPAVIMKRGPMHARESLPVKKLLSLSIIQQTNSYQCSLLGSITTGLLEKLGGHAH